MRPTDTLVRLGGDEFVLLCEAPAGEVKSLCQRNSRAVAEPIEVAGTVLSVTVSVGIGRTMDPSCTAAQLLREADKEMYRIKARRHRI